MPMVRFISGLLGALLLTVSCERAPEQSATAPPAGPAAFTQQVFQVNGVVQAVKPREKSVEIRHEAIPDYMPAMTMPFDVKDTNELAGLEPGEPVSFRLTVTATEGWIDQIRKRELPPGAGGVTTNGPPTTGTFRLVREVQRLEPGELLPEYHLVNQFSRPFSTAEFKGQALAITFLFTRCPYPNFCPRMANNFAAAQQKLLRKPDAPTNWHLLTISFDPEFDKPAVLKAYAEGFKYEPAHWTFATGQLIDVTALGEQFGLAFWHDENGGLSHNLRTTVVDAKGRVQRVFEGNEWTSDELVDELLKAAGQ